MSEGKDTMPGGPADEPTSSSATTQPKASGGGKTAWESTGSIFDRAKSPRLNSGEDRESGANLDAGGPVRGGDESGTETLGTPTNPTDSRQGAQLQGFEGGNSRTSNAGTTEVDIQAPRAEDVDVRHRRRSERLVSAWFLLSFLGTIAFVVFYEVDQIHRQYYTPALGVSMAVAIASIGVGVIVWAKRLMPDEEAVQEREPHFSAPEEVQATEEAFAKGFAETGFAKQGLIRRTLLTAVGGLGLLAILPLRSLGRGPRKDLFHTRWSKGARLVTDDGTPVKVGDLAIGGILTVFPEGHTDTESKGDSTVLLIRLRPGEDKPTRGAENWSYQGHVAYSKICTHAGCPVGLYEQQTHHLLCPCHQSQFDVLNGCKPIFGPAARHLPQLAITVDGAGYFVAQGDFKEPVGPSFWERS